MIPNNVFKFYSIGSSNIRSDNSTQEKLLLLLISDILKLSNS